MAYPTIDPYQLMVQRKQMQDYGQGFQQIQQHNQEDVNELEEFCYKHNIIGFNCGRMSPKAALSMLKRKLGVISEQKSNKVVLLG